MKKILYFLALSFIIVSCSKKDDPVVPDFDAVVSGESPNAKIELTNKSTGATSFKWNFDKGTTDSVSTLESPAILNVDRAGSFTIKLKAINGSEEQTITKTVTVPGYNAIVTYSDLEFGLVSGSTTYGRYFSFTTGKMYKDNEINSSNGMDIHIGLGNMSHFMFFFLSPDDRILEEDLIIPGATNTKINNWQDIPLISASAFDSMQDDRLLNGLTITNTNESFDTTMPNMILFQIATGRKGVIKAKAVNINRILVDIKIQKY